MKKKIMSALLLCVMAVLFCVPAFAANTSDTEASEPVVFKSTSLPEWFPEDAPALLGGLSYDRLGDYF